MSPSFWRGGVWIGNADNSGRHKEMLTKDSNNLGQK